MRTWKSYSTATTTPTEPESLPVGDLIGLVYTLDGINAPTGNMAEASWVGNWYRVAVKVGGLWSDPSLPFEARVTHEGICDVYFYQTLNRRPQAGYTCRAKLLTNNSALPGELLSSVVDVDVTRINGWGRLSLVRKDQFGAGSHGPGVYEITVASPAGDIVFSKRTSIPNVDAVNAEDLL
jgi:hypothetical protein